MLGLRLGGVSVTRWSRQAHARVCRCARRVPGHAGDKRCRLTFEAGLQLYGLARARVLTDNLLEADLGDLDQVPCGQAALVPTDLVDGA